MEVDKLLGEMVACFGAGGPEGRDRNVAFYEFCFMSSIFLYAQGP